MLGQTYYGADSAGAVTAAGGTAFALATTRKRGCRTQLDRFQYTAGATPHAVTVMKDIGKAALAADAAAGQAVVVLDSDPGPAGNLLAVGDWVVFIKPDGLPFLTTISAWTVGTKTATLTANVPAGGLKKGADVYNYGIPADTDPSTGGAHQAWTQAASVTTDNYNPTFNGLVDSFRAGAPLVIYSPNTTNAGTLNRARWLYAYSPPAPNVSGVLAANRPDRDDTPAD